MEKVFLNTKLIGTLSTVLSRPAFELRAATSIKPTTWHNIMKTPDSITVQQLLAIANGLRIPVRRFFSTSHTHYIGRSEEYVVHPYKECYYDSEKMRDTVNNVSDDTFQKVITADNTSQQRLRDSLIGVTRTPIGRFLTACEIFCIDPFTILIDPNPETEATSKQIAANRPIQEHTEPDTNDALHEDISALHQQIAQLNDTITELTSKYEQLLDRQARLLQRIDTNLKLSENNYPLIAAEPEPTAIKGYKKMEE